MLLAFDGGSLMYRMIYAHTKHSLSSADGQGTSALFFLVKSLRSYVTNLRPARVIMVQDAGYSERRRRLYPEYKAGRGTRVDADTDDERAKILADIRVQRAWASQMLPALGIRTVKIKGREADDLLAQLAIMAERDREHMIIVSDDKDMYQLVGPHVEVYRPRADETVSLDNFEQQTGVADPQRWLVWKCIVGDGSDNVPGVSGVGDKTAAQAVADGIDSFDVDTLLRADEHTNWRVRKIAEQLDTVLANRDILDLYAEEFDPALIERIRARSRDGVSRCQPAEVAQWFMKLEFRSLLPDLHQWIVPFSGLS